MLRSLEEEQMPVGNSHPVSTDVMKHSCDHTHHSHLSPTTHGEYSECFLDMITHTRGSCGLYLHVHACTCSQVTHAVGPCYFNCVRLWLGLRHAYCIGSQTRVSIFNYFCQTSHTCYMLMYMYNHV